MASGVAATGSKELHFTKLAIKGKGAQLVFANNNGKVQTPIHPKSGLPMLTKVLSQWLGEKIYVKASLFMALHCTKLNYGWKKPPPTLSEQQNKMKWQILQIQKMKLFLNAAAEPDSCYDFADEHNCKTIVWHLATE